MTWAPGSTIRATTPCRTLRRPVENPFQPDAPGMTVLRQPDSPTAPTILIFFAESGLPQGARWGLPCAGTAPRSRRPRFLQQTPVRIGHRPAKPVPQKPGGLVAAGADADLSLSLQLIPRDAVRMAGGDVRGHEPGAQRKMAAMHHRRLQPRPVAGPRTFPGRPIMVQYHGPMPRLCEPRKPDRRIRPAPANRPPSPGQIPRAGRLIGKERLELLARHRTILLPAGGHFGTIQEHAVRSKLVPPHVRAPDSRE